VDVERGLKSSATDRLMILPLLNLQGDSIKFNHLFFLQIQSKTKPLMHIIKRKVVNHMAKKQNDGIKVNCIYKDDGKKLERIIKEAFLLYVKGELSKKSA